MTVVVDSTALIYLAAIGRFDLLQTLFQRISIPSAVREEVVIQGAGRWGAAETANADWIDVNTVTDSARLATVPSHLDDGEREAIALAEELNAELVVMDESKGRQELKHRGLTYIGLVGVLILAKNRGLIVSLRSELDELRVCGFHLSDHLYQSSVASVGE